MKVSLVYNPDAGDGVSSHELQQTLAAGGYDVVHVLEKTPDIEQAMKDEADMVLVAGGDGTVARAAIAMRQQPLPLAILPMGTANNIASTLGLIRPLPDLMNRWRANYIRKIDLGLAAGIGQSKHFIEGVGGGLITAGIAAMDRDPRGQFDEANESLQRAIRTYLKVLSASSAHRVSVKIDDEDMRVEDLLLFEVLNTRSVGANVVVSRDAEPDDGWFSVVMAGEEHRAHLTNYLQQRIDGVAGHLMLPTRRAQRVQVQGWNEVHIDDEVRSTPAGQLLDLRMCPAMVNMLV